MPAVVPVESAELEVRSPLDGSVIERVPVTPPGAVASLVAKAKEAGAAWATVSMKERARRTRAIRDRFLESGPALAELLHRENGKSEAEALTSEVVPSLDLFDYWIKAAPGFLEREPISLNPVNFPGKRAYVDYEPRGVVALITPWNYPVSIPLRALVPALLAGNAIVWKPSEFSPLTARAVFEIFARELPPDVLQLVQGDGATGQALVDADIDLVCFTGSVATGKRIAARTAERLIPVSLELGGKNAAIVLEDADLDRTSAGLVWGAFANAGQNCAAVSRVYVVKAVADELEKRVRARFEKVRTGADGAVLYDVGPLVHPKQLAQVERHVEGARAAGTELLGGGRIGDKGNWYAPTILRAPAKSLPVSCEETFGPVMALTVVEDEAEAVRLANDSEYGLSASLWTGDLRRGERLAKALEVGTVTVNNTSFTPVIPNAPWSGRKDSGHGTTNSHRALVEMVKPRLVLLDKSKGGELWWFPHDETLVRIGRALLGMLHRSLLRKLAVVPTLLGLLGKRKKTLKALP